MGTHSLSFAAAQVSTADGFSVQISNYNAEFTWGVTTPVGTASISGGGLVTVTGLGVGQSSTISIATSRAGFNDGSADFVGTASLGAALIPEFDSVSPTADGFIVQIGNYTEAFVWVASSSAGSVSIDDAGLITVSDLAPSESATVTVTTSRAGYESGASEVSGSASFGAALTPEFSDVVSTADGFSVLVSNYDSDFTWDVVPTEGNASISESGLLTVSGLSSEQESVITVNTVRSGYISGSADIAGAANDAGSVLNVSFAVTDLSSTAFEEGEGDMVVLAFTFQADVDDSQINGFTLIATGSLDERNEVGAVKVFDDANQDGIADALELVAEGTYSADNGSVNFTFDEALPITTEPSQVLITYEL